MLGRDGATQNTSDLVLPSVPHADINSILADKANRDVIADTEGVADPADGQGSWRFTGTLWRFAIIVLVEFEKVLISRVRFAFGTVYRHGKRRNGIIRSDPPWHRVLFLALRTSERRNSRPCPTWGIPSATQLGHRVGSRKTKRLKLDQKGKLKLDK